MYRQYAQTTLAQGILRMLPIIGSIAIEELNDINHS